MSEKDVAAFEAGQAWPSSQPYPASVPDPLPPEASVPSPAVAPSLMPGQNVTIVIAHPPEQKSLCEAYMLCFPLGLLGAHNFYLRRYGMGVLYLFTLGGAGIGWIVDLIRMPWLVKEANHRILHPEEDVATVGICDAYITWFPLGIIGMHHYYLRNWPWAVAYTFTAGLFGIGWLVDACRIPSMVRATNKRLEMDRANNVPRKVGLCDAYALGATPAGILGAHHFYMGRTMFGVYYLLTLGGCGIGWIVDWFRMKWLVHRVNNPEEQVLGSRHKFLDDAYVMAFPFGILGLHNFYLERRGWGVLYLFTAGLFGIGWLVDLCRMPCLVSGANQRIEEELRIEAEIRQQLGVHPGVVIRRDNFYAPTPAGTVLPVDPNFQQQQQPPPTYEASTAAAGLAVGGSTYIPSTAPPEKTYQNGGSGKERF